jgi:DNA helicase-2/ATP-dependent DNA helicase PcrA
MNIYALGVQKLFGKLPKKASLFYIKHDKTVSYDVASSQVDKVREEIEEATSAILEERFDATPSFDACRKCPYWDICDSKEIEE